MISQNVKIRVIQKIVNELCLAGRVALRLRSG